jgi:alpha-D-ribose 1-methylphosphonate 5-triphosphate synthase subunit PhnG
MSKRSSPQLTPEPAPELTPEQAARRRRLSILAKADFADLEAAFDGLPAKPTWSIIRRPETGMVMSRARAGGTGARFNLGEVAVTRCTVRLDEGVTGHGYVMGRDRRHAELIAVVDALMQIPSHQEDLEAAIIEPLARNQAERNTHQGRQVAATKVDFFTVARGD